MRSPDKDKARPAVRPGDARARDLSPHRRRLVRLMQDLRFGEIRGLRIVGGEPSFSPFPEAFQDSMLGRVDMPHPATGKSDFALKSEVVALFELFDRDRDLTIDRIVVQAGLPLRIRVKVTSAE